MNARAAAAAGLVEIRAADARFWVAPDLVPALRDGGWLAPRRIEAALAEARRAGGGARGRAPVAVVRVGETSLVLRSLRRGGVLGPALGAAFASGARPLAEIAATARLRDAGAPVPRPAFAGSWRRGASRRGVVATHFEDGARDAENFLAARPDARRVAIAIERAAQAVRRFHDAGGWHADLHVKNLLVRELGADCEVLVIDLDRARVLASVSPRARIEQLMRLYRSLLKRRQLAAVGPRGAVAFLHAYVGGDRALRRAMLRRLPAERRRMARHALLYRHG